MAVDVDIDVEVLKCEIKKTYATVSEEPAKDFIFPTGRGWALDLGYPADLLGAVPDAAAESFAGVANPFALGPLAPGERVLDIGSGAGTDSFVAAQMVGSAGSVTGMDMTPEMLAKARAAAAEMGAENVRFVEGEAERLPFGEEFDVVISNGVIDLIPDKDGVYSEISRVLVPGGRIQIADVTILNPVSEEGRRNIDLWTGWIAGALLEAEYGKLLERHGFERIETGDLVETYARSAFEDTRRKAEKYGARGTTVKAYKRRR